MRQLIAEIEPQSWAPMGAAEESLDFGSPLIDGLYSLWLPSSLDQRTSYNAAHLSGRRAATIGESASAYYRRRAQSSPNPSTVAVPGGLGGNVPIPFGRAFAYSNEQAALSVGSLGYVPMYSGDGTGKVISFSVWFRINRINGTGFPTIIGSSFSTTWWLGNIVNWSCDAGPEFRITAADGLYELNLPYPTRRISRTCWKPFKDGLNCPYAGPDSTCDKGFDTPNGSLERRAVNDLSAGSEALRRPFHWPLEFPEVFQRNQKGFDAFVSNPPFMGGRNITAVFGRAYNDGLKHLYASPGTSCDLCSYFIARAPQLLSVSGIWGSVAVESIASGKTLENGLRRIVDAGLRIIRANTNVPWPGSVGRKVALIQFTNLPILSSYLNDTQVTAISANLAQSSGIDWIPRRLPANLKRCFQGITVNGKGFIVSASDREAFVSHDLRNDEVLTPYLTGDDLNGLPDPRPRAYAVNFHGKPEAEARTYQPVFSRLENTVKEMRTSITCRKDVQEKWWSLQRVAPELEQATRRLTDVLCRTRYGALHAIVPVVPNLLFSDGVIVFAYEDRAAFAVLQSDVHFTWALAYGSPRGGALRYKIKTCFETFSFPKFSDALRSIGTEYLDSRSAVLRATGSGLTATYNRFHDPEVMDADTVAFRRMHVRLNQVVVDAYGWRGLDLQYEFRPTRFGIRYCWSDENTREILKLLLEANKASSVNVQWTMQPEWEGDDEDAD